MYSLQMSKKILIIACSNYIMFGQKIFYFQKMIFTLNYIKKYVLTPGLHRRLHPDWCWAGVRSVHTYV